MQNRGSGELEESIVLEKVWSGVKMLACRFCNDFTRTKVWIRWVSSTLVKNVLCKVDGQCCHRVGSCN